MVATAENVWVLFFLIIILTNTQYDIFALDVVHKWFLGHKLLYRKL